MVSLIISHQTKILGVSLLACSIAIYMLNYESVNSFDGKQGVSLIMLINAVIGFTICIISAIIMIVLRKQCASNETTLKLVYYFTPLFFLFISLGVSKLTGPLNLLYISVIYPAISLMFAKDFTTKFFLTGKKTELDNAIRITPLPL